MRILCVCVCCINLALKCFTALCFQVALWLFDALCSPFSRERSSGTITYTVNTSCYPVDEMRRGGTDVKIQGIPEPVCINKIIIYFVGLHFIIESLYYFAFVKLEQLLTMCIVIHAHLPILNMFYNGFINVLIKSVPLSPSSLLASMLLVLNCVQIRRQQKQVSLFSLLKIKPEVEKFSPAAPS